MLVQRRPEGAEALLVGVGEEQEAGPRVERVARRLLRRAERTSGEVHVVQIRKDRAAGASKHAGRASGGAPAL